MKIAVRKILTKFTLIFLISTILLTCSFRISDQSPNDRTYSNNIARVHSHHQTHHVKAGLSYNKALKAKYFRCPGFHPSYRVDGLNIFKEKLFGFLGEIQCVEKDRVILMPPLLNHGNQLDATDGQQYLIPFGKYIF
jgi:hypothetical protein